MDRRRFLTGAAALGILLTQRPERLAGLCGVTGPGRIGPASGPGLVGCAPEAGRVGPRASGSALAVGVDPRIELYYAILHLSGFTLPEGAPAPVMTGLRFAYREAVEERFEPFRGHGVVERYADMARRGFWLGHPVRAMLHLSDPPALAERAPIDSFTTGMAGGRARLDAFLAGLRDFAIDAGFVDWFAAQASGHRAMLAGCRAALDRDYVADLVDYFGERCDSYTLILAPLAHAGGFGPRVRRADGGRAAFAVVGPKSIEDGVPAFGTPAQLRRLLWHELSHSHVNHLTERYLDGFMGPVTELQGHIRPEVERYVPWDVHVADWVSEHVVRGITTRLAYRELGRAEGDAALELELTGFPFTAEVAARLEQYERRRDRYPTLADFYPELVALFESVAG